MSAALQSETPYTREFFDALQEATVESARIIVPLVCRLGNVNSVVDVGCGRGAWLRVFKENGVQRVLGVDGDYVPPAELLIDHASFRSADLSKPLELRETFDLAVCLEVAEHLPRSAARPLVGSLTRAAPLVLFSAAIPGQGGRHHINEQWPAYWERLFAEMRYVRLDPVRRHIVHDDRVAPWYRQNVVLYASEQALKASPFLAAEREYTARCPLEYVNRHVLIRMTYPGGLMRAFLSACIRAVRNRIGI